MNKIIFVLLLALYTASCTSTNTGSWKESEREAIKKKCLTQIEQERLWLQYGIHIPKQKFCNCLAADLEKHLSFEQAKSRIEQVGLRLLAPDCLPNEKPNNSK